jgi:ISXO2-like transposase domain
VPPANRNNPRRAKSSTSDYSVTEFLADFPDDACSTISGAPATPLSSAVRTHVNPAAFMLTDDWPACKPLRREYALATINHSPGIYAEGDIHTNSIEVFFDNLKTGMRGAHKHVSDKHLQSCLDMFAWRHNNRFRGHKSMFHRLVGEAGRQ